MLEKVGDPLPALIGPCLQIAKQFGDIRLQHRLQHHSVGVAKGARDFFLAVLAGKTPMAVLARLPL
ncbi:MAG: hypothetical protein ACJ71Q_08595 [Terriglobales bacterium]